MILSGRRWPQIQQRSHSAMEQSSTSSHLLCFQTLTAPSHCKTRMITLQTTVSPFRVDGRVLTIVGFGKERRVFLNQEVLQDKMSFRDSFAEMLESVKTPFPECVQLLLDNVQLDPGFATFYSWCLDQDIPVVVLSSGMQPIIRALLTKLIGPKADKIDIISNEVSIKENGSWDILFRTLTSLLQSMSNRQMTIPTLATTSHLPSVRTLPSILAQRWSTAAMASAIYLLRVKPTCFSPSAAAILLLIASERRCHIQSSTLLQIFMLLSSSCMQARRHSRKLQESSLQPTRARRPGRRESH